MGGEGEWADDASVAQQRQYWRQHDVNLASAWGRRVTPEEPLPEQRAGDDGPRMPDLIVLPDSNAPADAVMSDAAAVPRTPASS